MALFLFSFSLCNLSLTTFVSMSNFSWLLRVFPYLISASLCITMFLFYVWKHLVDMWCQPFQPFRLKSSQPCSRDLKTFLWKQILKKQKSFFNDGRSKCRQLSIFDLHFEIPSLRILIPVKLKSKKGVTSGFQLKHKFEG